MENKLYENGFQDEPWDEMLDGRLIIMSPRPVLNHTRVTERITSVFQRFLKNKSCEAFGDGVDVYLTEKDRVVPDALIVCDKNIVKKTGVYGAPDLIVEVLSPSTAKRDRGYKKNLYEKCGVREYWIVEFETRSIEAYLLKDGKYELDEVYSVIPDYLLEVMTEEDKNKIRREFRTSVIPEIIVNIDEIFDGLILH